MRLTSEFRKDYRLRGWASHKVQLFRQSLMPPQNNNAFKLKLRKQILDRADRKEFELSMLYSWRRAKTRKETDDWKVVSRHDQNVCRPPLLHVDIWTQRRRVRVHILRAISKQRQPRPWKATHLWPVEKQQAQQCSLKRPVLTVRPLRGQRERQLCSYLGTKEGKASRWVMQFQPE